MLHRFLITGLPVQHTVPYFDPLVLVVAGMVHPYPVAEIFPQPVYDLRRQGDLRQEEQHLLAFADGFIDQL